MIQFMVSSVFIPFLNFSYSYIPNYGVAIIFLTIIVKLVFYPLTVKQMQSMKLSQKLQPEVKKLQEKYKDDPQKAHQEMMKLWKDSGSNPFAGCLPMLVQLPFFFAIYATMTSKQFLSILSSPGINHGLDPFWLTHLAHPDPYFILPVLIAALTWWTQKMMITDPKQASLFVFMPVVMGFMCIKMPAGVVLYWGVSQVISAAQQYWLMRPESELKPALQERNS
jgi:YidC/Oxa1 family membrane protein insertase